MRKLTSALILGLILLFTLPLGRKVSATDSEVSDLPLQHDNCNGTIVNITRLEDGTEVIYYDNGTIRRNFYVNSNLDINTKWNLVESWQVNLAPTMTFLETLLLIIRLVRYAILTLSGILAILGIEFYVNLRKRPREIYNAIRRLLSEKRTT